MKPIVQWLSTSLVLAATLVGAPAQAETSDAETPRWKLPDDELAAAVLVILASSPVALASFVIPSVEGPSGRAVAAPMPRPVRRKSSESSSLPLEKLAIVQVIKRGVEVDEVMPGAVRVIPHLNKFELCVLGRF